MSHSPSTEPWYRRLGPGLLAGAADDDPSGIAVYTQAGSQFGLAMLWMPIVTLPLMVAVQLSAARVGRGHRQGLVAVIRDRYSSSLAKALVVLVAIVNVINVGADLAAMGDATALVAGGKRYGYALAFGILSLGLPLALSYRRYARWLKWMTLVLLAYVVELGFVHVDWRAVLHAIALPHAELTRAYATTAVAVLGTTISPYLFVWQAALEAEEAEAEARAGSVERAPRALARQDRRMAFDTWLGMLSSGVVAFCIMAVGASVFFAHGQHGIQTAAQAAAALRPLAGHAALLVFALGIVGCGLVAIPAFAASAAYGCAEAWRTREGFDEPVARAPVFYAVIAVCIALGVAICFSPVDSMKALYWSAVLNGIAAIPMLAMVMQLASRRDIARELRSGPLTTAFGWLAVAAMTVATAVMIAGLAAS